MRRDENINQIRLRAHAFGPCRLASDSSSTTTVVAATFSPDGLFVATVLVDLQVNSDFNESIAGDGEPLLGLSCDCNVVSIYVPYGRKPSLSNGKSKAESHLSVVRESIAWYVRSS